MALRMQIRDVLGRVSVGQLSAALVIAGVLWVVTSFLKVVARTYVVRHRYDDIISLPRHPVWGNVINVGSKMKSKLGRHPDYGMEATWVQLGRPPAFLIDLAPISFQPYLVIADPRVIEQIVQPTKEYKYGVPKSDSFAFFRSLLGKESMITSEGEEWRDLRRRFNRGFAPAHLNVLRPLIIRQTETFVDRLRSSAREETVFELKAYAQDLTTDIITQVTMLKDYACQLTPKGTGCKSPLGLITVSRKLSAILQKADSRGNPLSRKKIVRFFKEAFYSRLLNWHIRRVLREKIQEAASPTNEKVVSSHDKASAVPSATSGKAIFQLALEGMKVDRALIDNTVAQIKTFLFAGQDTTATMIEWICYELSKAGHSSSHASFLRKLIEEHNEVFGSTDPFSALPLLSASTHAEAILNNRLPYTTAFVKEALRCHPPAGTARQVPEVTGDGRVAPFSVVIEDKYVQINGVRPYPCQWIMHRSPLIWGSDAHEFRPERWLDQAYLDSVPTGAWRPFERGPRGCIGQELAIMELKIMLCAVARGLRFEKIGNTGLNGEPEVWNIHEVTSVPCDGMRMRVHLR